MKLIKYVTHTLHFSHALQKTSLFYNLSSHSPAVRWGQQTKTCTLDVIYLKVRNFFYREMAILFPVKREMAILFFVKRDLEPPFTTLR